MIALYTRPVHVNFCGEFIKESNIICFALASLYFFVAKGMEKLWYSDMNVMCFFFEQKENL